MIQCESTHKKFSHRICFMKLSYRLSTNCCAPSSEQHEKYIEYSAHKLVCFDDFRTLESCLLLLIILNCQLNVLMNYDTTEFGKSSNNISVLGDTLHVHADTLSINQYFFTIQTCLRFAGPDISMGISREFCA